MASRPVKCPFGRRKSISTTFRPPKGGLGRTGIDNRRSSDASEPLHRARSKEVRHLYFATRKTPLNTRRTLQRSTKGVT